MSIGKLGQFKYKYKSGVKLPIALIDKGVYYGGGEESSREKKSMSKNGKCQVIQVKQLVNCLFHQWAR